MVFNGSDTTGILVVPSTVARNALPPTTVNTQVFNEETGRVERWNGSQWIADLDRASGVFDAKAYGAKGDGITDDRGVLDTLANVSIPVSGGSIYFPPGTYKIGSNLTIPSHVTLLFARGASLVISDNVFLTIRGDLDAGLYQIFQTPDATWGTGRVLLTPDAAPGVLPSSPAVLAVAVPQWWGARGDGTTDDYRPLQRWIDATIGSGTNWQGFATGGTSTTITKTGAAWTSNQFIGPDGGSYVHIAAGTGRGQFRVISSMTSDTLTVTTAWTTIPNSTSQFEITFANNIPRVADIEALLPPGTYNTTATLRRWNVEGHKIRGSSRFTSTLQGVGGYSSTVSSATSTTLTKTGATWELDRWFEAIAYISAGKGAGQSRLVARSTADTLTVTVAWTVVPDVTSAFIIFIPAIIDDCGAFGCTIEDVGLSGGGLGNYSYNLHQQRRQPNITQRGSSQNNYTRLFAAGHWFNAGYRCGGDGYYDPWQEDLDMYDHCTVLGQFNVATPAVWSKATAGTLTTITDTTQSWATNAYAGSFVEIIAGAGAGQSGYVESNTATVLTLSAIGQGGAGLNLGGTPDSTSVYLIFDPTQSTYWRYGFSFGTGVIANNFNHTLNCPTESLCQVGFLVSATNVQIFGATIQSNRETIVLNSMLHSYFAVYGIRDEQSRRFLSGASAQSVAVNVAVEDFDLEMNQLLVNGRTGKPDAIWCELPGSVKLKNGRALNHPIDLGTKKVSAVAGAVITAVTLAGGAPGFKHAQWIGGKIKLTSGSGSGQVRKITSNTLTTLTLDIAFSPQPAVNDTFDLWLAPTISAYTVGGTRLSIENMQVAGSDLSDLLGGIFTGEITNYNELDLNGVQVINAATAPEPLSQTAHHFINGGVSSGISFGAVEFAPDVALYRTNPRKLLVSQNLQTGAGGVKQDGLFANYGAVGQSRKISTIASGANADVMALARILSDYGLVELAGTAFNTIERIVSQLGGNSTVEGIYHTGFGVTQAAGKITQWDDARGSSGFGPSFTAVTGGCDWNAGAVEIVSNTSGYLQTAALLSPMYNGKTLIVVGALDTSTTSAKAVDMSDNGVLGGIRYGVNPSGSNIDASFYPGGAGHISSVALSANKRLMFARLKQNERNAAMTGLRVANQAETTEQAGPTFASSGSSLPNMKIELLNGITGPNVSRIKCVIVLKRDYTATDYGNVRTWSASEFAHVDA